MVGTLHERRNKWCEDNGVNSNTTTLKLDGETVTVPDGQPFDLDGLLAFSDAVMSAFIGGSRYAELGKLVISTANEKVNSHIDPTEKAHWMGVADALARKQSLYIGDQLGDNPDPVAYPPLTFEEHQTWFSLSLIQASTAEIRGAATAIIGILHIMASEQINVLTDDWVINHQLWP